MKIELYKSRTLSERFSATADFVQENWKLYLKNVCYIGIPLGLLMGYFMHRYMIDVFSNINVYSPMGPPAINWGIYSLTMLTSALFSLFICALTGSILYNYAKETLSENTTFSELKEKIFPFMGKMLLLGLIFLIVIAVFSFLFGDLVTSLALSGKTALVGIITLFFVLLFFALLIVFLPFLLLLYCPIFFDNASIWQALKKSMRLGFKYWASTFGTGLLGILLVMVTSYIIVAPYWVYIMFNMDGGGIFGYLLAMLIPLASLILTPIIYVFMGFQYTSIIKKEEE